MILSNSVLAFSGMYAGRNLCHLPFEKRGMEMRRGLVLSVQIYWRLRRGWNEGLSHQGDIIYLLSFSPLSPFTFLPLNSLSHHRIDWKAKLWVVFHLDILIRKAYGFFFFFHKFSIALHCALRSLFCVGVKNQYQSLFLFFCLSVYYFLYFIYTCNSTFNHHYVFVNIS